MLFFFFFEKQTHKHTQGRGKNGSNTKAHHNFTQKPWFHALILIIFISVIFNKLFEMFLFLGWFGYSALIF